jgi:MoaA/NifB/PqqE/SkfB family radical SAM enzyme
MKDYLSNEQFSEKDILSLEKIIETFDCMNDMGIHSLQLTGGGEPLFHPSAFQILKGAFEKKLEVALVSNGQLLTEAMCDLLGDAAWVRISMDAASPVLYSFIRNISKSSYYKVFNNIKNLVQYRRTSIIGIGFVVERENFKEIYEAARIYKDLGVDNFRISAAFTPMGYEYFKDFQDEARDLSKKAESLSDSNFTVFNLFNDRVKDNFEGIQNYSVCPIKDLLTYIGADYNVYTCCTHAYNHMGLIGSIKEKSFKEVWESPEKRELFSKHNPSVLCQHPCMYKSKNDFINYCTKQNPRHINYI